MTSNKPQRLRDPDVLLSILDKLPTSIFVKDSDLRFVYSNEAHCTLIGRPEAELLEKSDSDFYPAHEAEGFLRNDKDVMERGDISVSEEGATSVSGHTVTVQTRKVRHEAPDGRTYLIGTNTDLTDIKKQENLYKALTATVPVGVVQIEEGGGITFANPLFNVYCGGDGYQEAGERLIQRLAQDHAGFPGTACKFEGVVQALGTEPRHMMVFSSGWLNLGAEARSAIISIIDVSEVTELRRINDEVSRLNRELATNMKKLAEAQDELVKKGRMEQLGQLTATVAHELRNPLGAVRTSAFLLDRKLRGKDMGVEAQIDRINKGILRCDNIITQLLDFSRTKQLTCQSADLDQWLAQVLDEEARKLPAAVSITVTLGLEGAPVPFDPSRLQRAIVNLVSNAAEALQAPSDAASRPADWAPHIHIETRFETEWVVIEVTDNGPGMSLEVLQRVREPLYTTKSFGTGLGIPAIEQIAVQHGGRLDIVSATDSGATFTLWLPRAVTDATGDGTVAA